MRVNIFASRRVSRLFILIGAVMGSLVMGCSSNSEGDTEETQQAWPELTSERANEFVGQCQSSLSEARKRLEDLEAGDETDQEAFLGAINALDTGLNRMSGRSSLYFNVHPDPEVREAAQICREKLVELSSDISLSTQLYSQVVDINTEPLEALDRRYVEEMLEGFERSGVNQDETTRDKIRQLNDEINKLGQTFGQNIREDVRQITIKSAERLDGLPQDYIDAHSPNEDGEIVITTNYPDYLPVMTYAKDDHLRLELYTQFRKRGYPENEPVLRDLLRKRYELARLLGYKNYAQYVTENKMIETPVKAQAFIDEVAELASPRARAEYQVLLDYLQERHPDAEVVGDWQKTYLEELVKQEQFQVDAQKVRQYFQYSNVRDGIFELSEKLFGIEIRPWEKDTWHSSVEPYEVWDGDDLIGRFYLDMHPREGKYKHAAAFSVQDGIKGIQLPIKALVCNFPGAEGPGYMEHSQVETFLHEFGHLLHGIFGGHQKWMSFSGIKTEWDFVEAPSQMLEEWVWDYETLSTFAHNSEGEILPKALFDKMNLGRDFGKGLFTRHQLFYASVSLNYYNRDPDSFEFLPLMRELQSKYSPFDYVEDTYFHTSFGHLNGYSAIYYTYMWSSVIASDMFSEFRRNGLLDRNTAQRYRQAVLEPGGSKDAAELVKDFLGRPYSFDAFAKELKVEQVEGLKP